MIMSYYLSTKVKTGPHTYIIVFKCLYCGKKRKRTQLTYDQFCNNSCRKKILLQGCTLSENEIDSMINTYIEPSIATKYYKAGYTREQVFLFALENKKDRENVK